MVPIGSYQVRLHLANSARVQPPVVSPFLGPVAHRIAGRGGQLRPEGFEGTSQVLVVERKRVLALVGNKGETELLDSCNGRAPWRSSFG